MELKTILFDLDGTLLNTNELIRKSFIHTFELYNIPYDEDDLAKYNGPPLLDTFSELNPGYAEEMVKAYRRFNVENHEENIHLFPNAIEMLKELHEANIKTAIVTNKMRDVALLGMEQTNLIEHFTPERIVTLSDVSKAKPHPEGILKAMNILDSDVSSTAIVGDSRFDIEAGHRAGIQTIGVSWSEHGVDFLRSYHPTQIINDLSELLDVIS